MVATARVQLTVQAWEKASEAGKQAGQAISGGMQIWGALPMERPMQPLPEVRFVIPTHPKRYTKGCVQIRADIRRIQPKRLLRGNLVLDPCYRRRNPMDGTGAPTFRGTLSLPHRQLCRWPRTKQSPLRPGSITTVIAALLA
jgi:hypothetical protein